MAMEGRNKRDAGAGAAPCGGAARGPAGRAGALATRQGPAEPAAAAAAEAAEVTAEGEAGAAKYKSGAVDQEDIWEFIHENIKARTRARIQQGIDEGIQQGIDERVQERIDERLRVRIDERIREGIRKRHDYDYRVAIPRMLARAQAIEMAFESH